MSATQHLHQQSGAASIRSHLLLLVLAMAVPLALVVIFGLLARYQKPVLAWFDQHVQPRFFPAARPSAGPDQKKINEVSVG